MNISRESQLDPDARVIPCRWKRYEGLYPEPTDIEFQMIYPYLLKYRFEDEDFVEEEDEKWLSLKKAYRCPNLRARCMEFLHVIRESKGYDLTSIVSLFEPFFKPVSPLKHVKLYNRCVEAAPLAITEINTQTIPRGKRYQFYSLDNCVWTNAGLQLLTITVKEFEAEDMEVDDDDDDDDDDEDIIDYELCTIRAMMRQTSPHKFELKEWKFKSSFSYAVWYELSK